MLGGIQMYNNPYNYNIYNQNNDRFVGGFVFPFLLGGVTGAALAPNFWGNRPNNVYYPYQPYPVYGPYYRPYR